MEEHTIAYSKSTRKNHIDARGKIDDEANTLSCGDGCTNQSTGNYVFTKVETDMADIKFIYGETAPNQPRKSLYKQKGRVYSTEGISPTTTTEADKNAHVIENEEEVTKEQEERILKLASVDNQTRKEHIKNKTVPDVEIEVEEGKCIATRHLGRNGKLTSDISSTVQVAETPCITDTEIRIRKLTPVECERLMSWPCNWTKYGVDENGKQYELSDSARYKACGNGIVSNIPKALLDYITGDEQGLRVFSTFAGVDGSGLYLKEPKYVKVGFSEYEPKMKAQHAANVLRYHYPKVPNLGDITQIDVKDVPDHDIIFISAPCQSFSSAGKHAGIEDARGTLFY